MPVYNEENNIENFVMDLVKVFKRLSFQIIIVNDASTDDTYRVIENLKNQNFPILIINNSINIGHGKASLLGMKEAIKFHTDFILTVDGDGNVKVDQLREMLNLIKNKDSIEVLEGIRVNRVEPWFRSLVSWITRKIVYFASRGMTNDANTPIKLYRKEVLNELLKELPQDSLIPNLRISILVRILKYKIMDYQIENMTRNVTNISGTTWGQKKKHLPSRKFILFCFKAGQEVIELLRNPSPNNK